MTRRLVVLLGLALALATPARAGAVPNTQCALTTQVQEVHSVSQLPPELLRLLLPMADVGAPWNHTDSVSDPTLPFRRLIRAGAHGSDWFVWYEQGGAGYSWHAVVAQVVAGEQPKVLANAGTISDTLCTLTDGAIAGKVPPYPPGAWATQDF
jgi:hypothetical protein